MSPSPTCRVGRVPASPLRGSSFTSCVVVLSVLVCTHVCGVGEAINTAHARSQGSAQTLTLQTVGAGNAVKPNPHVVATPSEGDRTSTLNSPHMKDEVRASHKDNHVKSVDLHTRQTSQFKASHAAIPDTVVPSVARVNKKLLPSTNSTYKSSACMGSESCDKDDDCAVGVCRKGRCREVKYSTLGGKCDLSAYNYCVDGLKCRNGTCYQQPLNSTCVDDSDCFRSSCINKVCDIFRSPHDECTDNAHCSSGMCIGGFCNSLPLDAKCDPHVRNIPNPCAKGAYCSSKTSTCVSAKSIGSSCYLDDGFHNLDLCAGGSICDVNNVEEKGVCRSLFSAAPGDVCHSHGKAVCRTNLSCRGAQCVATGNATEKCDKSNGCPAFGVCTCHGCDYGSSVDCSA
eukprot:GFYU01036645.1.p1 GENE.GFYU01036645.1~~GFYU01036645.1.p1  ORF type:complete len:399 (-),score=78.42 GFYU01036645.1:22-1218(-)